MTAPFSRRLAGWTGIGAPFLFALYLAVGAYREVKPLAGPWEAVQTVPALLLIAGLVLLVLRWALRDTRKAVLLAVLVLFYAGLSGEILITVKAFFNTTRFPVLGQVRVVLSVLTGLALLLAWGIIRARRDLTAYVQAVSAAITALLIMAFGGLWFDGRDREVNAYLTARPPLKIQAAGRLPDVYFIMLDAFTSVDSLSKYWGYEATGLVDSLEAHGFQVIQGARSNFAFTPLCLATDLNMDLPPRFSFPYDTRYGKNTLLRLSKEAAVPKALKQAGYEVVNLAMTPLLDQTSTYVLPPNIASSISFVTVRRAIEGRSVEGPINEFLASIRSEETFRQSREHVADPLDQLIRLSREKSSKPRFFFVHVLLPHQPFYYTRDGGIRKRGPVTPDAYLDQLVYTSRKVSQVVDDLLKQRDSDPVIVIQGDHGYRFCTQLDKRDQMIEAHSCLFAYRIPGNKAVKAWEGITTVNFFRLVFNQAFHTELPYTEDRIFETVSLKGIVTD